MRLSLGPDVPTRYGVAIVASALAVLLWLLLDSVARVSPFPLLITAVAFSAWYGGLGPGLLATVLGTLAIDYFYEEPLYSLAITAPDTIVKLAIFVVAAFVVSHLTDRLRATTLEAEKARAESQAAHAQLLQTLERISDGFFALDREGRFTYFNPQAMQILLPHELPAARLAAINKPIWQVLPAGSGVRWEETYRRAMAKQAVTTFEDYYPALQRWVEFRIYPDSEGLSVFCRESRRTWTEPIEA